MEDDWERRELGQIECEEGRVLDPDDAQARLHDLLEEAASGAEHLIAAPSGKLAVLISYDLYATGLDLKSLLLEPGTGPDEGDPTDLGQ